MKTPMRLIAILALVASTTVLSTALPAHAQLQCPNGSYPALDSYGNNICRRFSDQSTAVTQTPQGQQCPNGAYPTIDGYGNTICRSFATPNQPTTDYYNTSHGCPNGTYQSIDTYGNQVCKRFGT